MSTPTPPLPDPSIAAAERRAARRAALRATAGKTARGAARGRTAVVENVRSWDPDRVRQVAVTAVLVGAGLGVARAAGIFGGEDLRDAPLGTLDPSATLLSLAAPAHYLWLVIGCSLIGYTAHQWLPSQGRSPRHRGLGWMMVISLLLMLGAVLAIQRDLATTSLVLVFALLAVVAGSLRWLNHYPAQTRTEGILVDVPFGLWLGWTGVSAATHTAAVLTSSGADWLGLGAQRWALVGVVLLILAAMAVCMTDRGRIAVAVAVVWGLGCLIFERLLGDLQSIPVAFTAGLSAFLLIIAAGSRRHRVDHAYRRELRAQQMATVAPIDFDDDEEPVGARP